MQRSHMYILEKIRVYNTVCIQREKIYVYTADLNVSRPCLVGQMTDIFVYREIICVCIYSCIGIYVHVHVSVCVCARACV